MMIYQGLEAFYLWTGHRISEGKVDHIFKLLNTTLSKHYG
ncbi:MAG: hypothetical protein IT292_01060 [Deltaproteobacteria bacterium]|nr:hypothetical protein [Deltaproteobacteria bacterium]